MCAISVNKKVRDIRCIRPIKYKINKYKVNVWLHLTEDERLLQQHEQMAAFDVELELL